MMHCGTTGSCGAGQKKGRRKFAHLSSAGKKSFQTMMKRNRKRRGTKRTGAKRNREHIANKAYDTDHVGSKATSQWQWVWITLHAGFTKILLSQQNKFRLYWQQRERRAERTNVKYDWQVSSGNTGWEQRSAGYEVTAPKAQSQRVIDPTKKGGKWKQGMWTCGKKRQRQLQSTVTAGDRSNQKWGKMEAGYVNLRKKRKRQQRKVGRKEE